MVQQQTVLKVADNSGARELMVVGGGHSTSFEYTDTVILPELLDFYASV